MTDQLNVVINPKVVVDGLSSLAQVRAAIAEINNTPVSQIKQAMLGLTGSLKSLSTELESVFSGLSSQVTKAMGDAEVKGKAGAKKLKKTLQTELDENAPVVNIRVSAKSVTLPGGLKAAISQAGVDNLGALAEMRKSLTDMAGSADTSSAAYKNLTKNAQFAKKSLEEQLAVAKLVKEASKIDGVTAQQLTEQNGTKAVWASRNIAAVEAKVQAQAALKEQLAQSDVLFKNTLSHLKDENAARQVSAKEQLTQRAADLKAADRMELESFRAANAAKQAEAARTARIVANQSMSAGTPITSGSYSVIGGPNEGALRQVNKAMQDGVPAAKNLQAAKAALRGEMHELHSAARGLASGFGAMWLTWGSIVPLMAGAAVSSALVQTVKIGAEVQDSLTRMQVLTDESSTSIGNLNTKLLELARTGPIGPKEIAEAMKTMALAGQSAEEVSTSIKDVLNFALAGDVSIKTSADTLTTVGTAFKIGADGFGYMADVISKVAAESKSSVEDMAGAMKTASVINQQYGVSLEEVAVGNALLANAGIRGTAAGTALRNMYADLGGKTKKVADELKNLGVVAFDPLTGRMRDTGKVFKELMNALETQKTPEGARKSMETLFGERGSREAFALMDALGRKAKAMGTDVASAYDEMRKAAEESAGFTAISAAKIALTPLNQMKSVTATLQATLSETFDSLSPYLVETARHMKEIFSSDGFKTTLRDIVTTLGAITVFVTDHAKAIAAFVAGLGLLKSVAAFAGQVGSALTILGGTATATAGAVGTIGTAARLASAANPILMALTTLISAAAFAWGVYEIARGKSAKLNEGSALKGMEDLIKNLETEEAHIKDVNEARKKGIDLRDQERQRIVSAYQLEGVVEVERAREKMLESSAALSRFKSTNTGMGSYLSGNAIQDGQRLKGLEDQAKSDAQALERLQNTRSGNLARMAQLDASIKKEADYSARMIESDKVMEDWRNRKKYKGTDNGSKPEKSTATTEKLSAHEKISKAIQEELTLAKAQLDSNDKLSASEKYRIKTLSEINDQYLRGETTVKEWAQEAKDAWEAADLKKQIESQQENLKVQERLTSARDSSVQAHIKELDAINDKAQKLEDEVALYGRSATAIEGLTTARMLDKIEVLRGFDGSAEEIARIEATIVARKRRASATTAKDLKDADTKAAAEAHKEWQKTADKINDSITDALMRGFENGKGFAENLRDTLINMFKTMVLRPTISAAVNPITQGITGAFQAAGSSMLGSAAGGLGSGALFSAAGMTALGESFGASAMATMTGSTFANATVVGQFAGAGATGTGIASTLGAAMPYIAAAVLAYKILSGSDAVSSSDSGRARIDYTSTGVGGAAYSTTGSAEQIAKMTTATEGLAKSYFDTAKALGIAAIKGAFEVGTNTGREGANSMTVLGANVGSKSFSSGEFSSADTAAYSLAASRAVFAALQGSDLPAYLVKVFNGVTADALSQDQITNTLAYAASLKQVRDALVGSSDPLVALQTNVDRAFADMATSADTFKTDFVSAIDGGISPEKLAQWQSLQMAMTELAALAEKDAASKAAAAKTIRDNVEKEIGIATSWAQKLAVLQGTTTDRKLSLEADIASTNNEATKALIGKVYALEDEKTATETMADAATKAADAVKTAADNYKSATDALASANDALKSSYASVSSAYKAIQDAATNAANAVTGAQDNITNGYLSAQAAVASAQDNLANVAVQASKAMAGFADSIQNFLVEMATTDLGANSKAGQLAALQADFAITSAQAKAGDQGALGSLTGKAGALLKAGKEQAATALDFARLSSSVANALTDISSTIAPSAATADTDPAVKAQKDLASAQADLAKWTKAIEVSGASTTKVATDYLDDWRKATAASAVAQADLLRAQDATKGIQMGIEDGIGSLTDAITALNKNISAQLQAMAQVLATMTVTGTGGTAAAAATYKGADVAQAVKDYSATGATTAQTVATASTGYGVTSGDLAKVAAVAGSTPEMTALVEYQKRIDATTALSALERDSVVAEANRRAGVNSTSAQAEFVKYLLSIGWNAGMGDKAMGWGNGTTNAWATSNGFPAFEQGINYLPRDTMAMLHEGEAVVPKQYNPYNPNAAGNSNSDTAAALRAMADRLDRIEANTRAAAGHAAATDRKLARVIPGNALITEVAV